MKWGERKNTWVCQRLSIYLFKEEMHCHFQALVETTHHLTLESILYLHTARPEQQEISHSMCKWTVGFTGDWTQLSFWEKPSQPIDRFSTEVLMWLCFCIFFFTACGMESMQCCAVVFNCKSQCVVCITMCIQSMNVLRWISLPWLNYN